MTNMTRKEFEAIGAAIYDAPVDEEAKEIFAFALADALVSQSDSFDPVRFLESCGVQGDDLGERVRAYSTRLAVRQRGLSSRRMTALEVPNRPVFRGA